MVDRANQFCVDHPNYRVRATRRERIAGRLQDAELMDVVFRLEPRSVHYCWVDEKHTGRQCVWVDGRNDGKLVTIGGKSDWPFRGRKVSVDPQGLMARSRSRYTINMSGLDQSIKTLDERLRRLENGASAGSGKVTYLGEYEHATHGIHAVFIREEMPPGDDPFFPNGGRRDYGFDPKSGQLLLIEGHDANGSLLELYKYENFEALAPLSDRDFDPDRLGGGQVMATPAE